MKYKIGDKIKAFVYYNETFSIETNVEIIEIDESNIPYKVSYLDQNNSERIEWICETKGDEGDEGEWGWVSSFQTRHVTVEEIKSKNTDSFFLIIKRESDEKTKKENASRPKNSPFEWL
jgi:hypothetical protein